MDNVKSRNIFDRSTFCLVTGASKGLGKALSVEIGRNFDSKSLIVLIARNEEGLLKTKYEIQGKSKVNVVVRVFDFEISSNSQSFLNNFINEILNENSSKIMDFEQAIIIHNAGTIGDVSKAVNDNSSLDYIRKYFDVNLTSVVGLNSVFWNTFKQDVAKFRYCINISSLCAVKPIKSNGLYCTGKAARDMLFQVMAEEEPGIRVLNYAPGPLDTDMSATLRETCGDLEVKRAFMDLYEKQKLIDPTDSVNKLIPILKEDSFKSGAHVDFYD